MNSGNREDTGGVDMRIFSGVWKTRENEKTGNGDNSEFRTGRNHSSNLTSTLSSTVPSILKGMRAPSN